ncbi:hypothetical protein CR513_62342, partial [Mucuna pruriens]
MDGDEDNDEQKGLTQRSKGVEDYYKEMEVIMIIANVQEKSKVIPRMFLNGLHRDIQNVVELHYHMSMKELLHQVIKVEKQLNMKKTYKKTSNYNYLSWKEKLNKEGFFLNNKR